MKLYVFLLLVMITIPLVVSGEGVDIFGSSINFGEQTSGGIGVNIVQPIFNLTTLNVTGAELWLTDIGPLNTANATQHSNSGGVLNILESWVDSLWCRLSGCTMEGNIDMDGNDIINVNDISANNVIVNGTNTNNLYINKPQDLIPEQVLQINFTFSNSSAPPLENFNSFRIKNLNDTSANSFTAENDGDIRVSLFTSGSNFLPGLGINNRAGIAATNTDLILATRNPNRSIIMQIINSTGSTVDTLVVEGDGNVILQNDLILNLSSIFYDDIGDRFTKINSEGFPFDGVATDATWFGHNNIKEGGEVTYLFTVENRTELVLVSGLNNSFGFAGNSFGVVPEYMAEENFTEIDGTINMSKATNYPFLCGFFGVPCSFVADTRGNAIDDIPGGPLLWTMGDLEVWQSAKIHRGIAVSGAADFDLEGNDADFNNGSVHILKSVTFEQGFTAGDSITKFQEIFSGNLGIFSNLQSDLGDWASVINSVLCDDGECARGDGAGVGLVEMQTNISTLDINETTLSFIYSLVNLIGSGEFSVEVNNNVGSGDVVIFSDTTSVVVTNSESISLPSSMDNQPSVSITFICNIDSSNKPNRQCLVDTVKLNGTAMTTTAINVSDFDSEICGADGSRDVDGNCNVGIRWDAETAQWIFAGTINASGTITGGVSGTGTSNNVPKWNSPTSLTNSQIIDDGSLITIGLPSLMQGDANFSGFDITNVASGFFNFIGSSINRITKGWFVDLDVSNNINVENNITLGNGAIIGYNATCAFIFYNQTGSIIETKGCI